MSISAVTGVTLVAVEGESAASTACDSEVKVTIGGRIGSWLAGGFATFETSGGLSLDGERPLVARIALGDWFWRSPKPPKEPREPDNLFEKLLLLL